MDFNDQDFEIDFSTEIMNESLPFSKKERIAINKKVRRQREKEKMEKAKAVSKRGYKPSLSFEAYRYNSDTRSFEYKGYLKHSSSSRRQKHLKKQSNRKVRYNKETYNNSKYKREFDYWYEWF